METNELINLIKNGDDYAFKLLLDAHHNMIYKIIFNLDISRGDFSIDKDSLYQEGSLALYKSVFSYDEKNNMSFTSYAYMVIRSRLHTYVRDNYKHLEHEPVSIDNIDNLEYRSNMASMYVAQDPIQYHHEKQFEEQLNKFMSKLNKTDQKIFTMRSDNFTYKQIARKLHTNTKKIDNRLRVLRERLKRYLDNQDD